jgi:hypothetical protein
MPLTTLTPPTKLQFDILKIPLTGAVNPVQPESCGRLGVDPEVVRAREPVHPVMVVPFCCTATRN